MEQEETLSLILVVFPVSQLGRICVIGKSFLTFAVSLAKVRPAFRLGPDAASGDSAGACVFLTSNEFDVRVAHNSEGEGAPAHADAIECSRSACCPEWRYS